MTIEIRLLSGDDEAVLRNVHPLAFDDEVVPEAAKEFLDDPRHHLAVAVDDGLVVGFVSAVLYVHPDKSRPELWINEVGVAPSHHRQGLARQLMELILDLGRQRGCGEAWVLTDRENVAAMRLYESAGGEAAPTDQVMFTFFLDPSARDFVEKKSSDLGAG